MEYAAILLVRKTPWVQPSEFVASEFSIRLMDNGGNKVHGDFRQKFGI